MSEAKYASGGNQFESMRLPVIEYIRNDGIEPERERERTRMVMIFSGYILMAFLDQDFK